MALVFYLLAARSLRLVLAPTRPSAARVTSVKTIHAGAALFKPGSCLLPTTPLNMTRFSQDFFVSLTRPSASAKARRHRDGMHMNPPSQPTQDRRQTPRATTTISG